MSNYKIYLNRHFENSSLNNISPCIREIIINKQYNIYNKKIRIPYGCSLKIKNTIIDDDHYIWENNIIDLKDSSLTLTSLKNLNSINKIIDNTIGYNNISFFYMDYSMIFGMMYKFTNIKEISFFGMTNMNIFNEIGQLVNLESLSFSFIRYIRTIPKFIYKLEKLTQLDIYNCYLEKIDSDINKLTKLKILNLKHNKLKNIPDEIYKMETLEKISLDNNYQLILKSIDLENYKNITKISLNKCTINNFNSFNKKLIKLNISDCKLENIPDELYNLVQLEFLNIEKNKIKTISDDILNMINLKTLLLGYNDDIKVSKNIYKLVNLENLTLTGCQNIISYDIINLKNLAYLNIMNNNLVIFPEYLMQLPKLHTLSYEFGNFFSTTAIFLNILMKQKNINQKKINQLKKSHHCVFVIENFPISYLWCEKPYCDGDAVQRKKLIY